jgi:hypothetical protein
VAELIDLAQKLSGASLAVLLVLVLAGSYFDTWCWSREREAMKAEREAMKADRDEWKKLSLQILGAAEKAVNHAARLTSPPGGSAS